MRPWLPPLVLSAGLLAGCGAETEANDTGGPSENTAGGADLEVVVAVYPLAWVAGQIAPGADVDLLNQGGQEAHDLDLSPAQRAAVETADVVLYVGDIDYQPQVEEAVSAATGQVVSAAEAAGEEALLAAAVDAHADEEAPADATAPAAAETHSEEGGVDPHLWFNPSVMADVVTATSEAFAAADPDNASTYEQNAIDVLEQLATLGEDLEQTLGQECRLDEAIVSHAAYGYLLGPFGKEQHAVTGVGAESDASAGELAEIVEEIREQGVTHVLAEPVEGRAGAEAVVAESGVDLLEILPLDAVSDAQAEIGLPDLVREQAAAFATALGCE